ncbi:MAG: phage Gp37/Gp68 family protein [Mesorhizobium sp.]|nr:MAG: phage Gp37/Gp68 family protein [Mesorhizobium sp.]
MADKSNIEWTDATWNPIVGCSILSPGCISCYAMKMASRIEAMTKALKASGAGGAPHYDGTTRKVNGNAVWTGKLALAPDRILTEPLRWKRPRRIFVNSMGDLFHEDVPDEWIDRVFAVMAMCPQHTFQVLTKRAKRMQAYAAGFECDGARRMNVASAAGRMMEDGDDAHDYVVNLGWPLPNVWLGVSTERQQEADERIPELLATPAAIRFISAEPLLGRIDLAPWLPFVDNDPRDSRMVLSETKVDGGIDIEQQVLDWIIVGGESGPDARPMHPAWARSIRDQALAAGVPFFFKQWGEWAPNIGAIDGWTLDDNPEISRFDHLEWEDGRWSEVFRPMWCDFQDGNYDEEQCVSRLGKKRAGRTLDGVEHNAFPTVA